MKWAIRAIGLATAGLVGAPSLIAAFAPLWRHRRTPPYWQPLGAFQEFPVGEMREVVIQVARQDWSETLREKIVYAWRPTEQEAVVYSRSCTDLGCPLRWDPGSQCFFCPCHGGIFDKSGERMAGPPAKPMYRYATRIINGGIEIDLNSLPPMA